MKGNVYKAIFLLIGVATLGYMVYSLGIEEIWINIQKTGVWFIPVIGSWLVIYLLNAWAFKAIIQEDDKPETNVPFSKVAQLTISGYAINYITPFVALGGEPYRIMELKPYVGTNKATSSVLLYGLMHMFSHVLFWFLSVGLIVAVVDLTPVMLAGCIGMFFVSLLLGLWFVKVYKKGFTMSSIRLLSKLPWVGKKAQKIAIEKGDNLTEIDNQISILYADRKDRFYLSLVLEFVARVVGCLEIYFTGIAIGLDMSVFQALVISSVSSLFANLIFFFPMQLGTREGGLALSLSTVGLSASAGIFIGVVLRIREIVWIFIGLALMGKKTQPAPVEVPESEVVAAP